MSSPSTTRSASLGRWCSCFRVVDGLLEAVAFLRESDGRDDEDEEEDELLLSSAALPLKARSMADATSAYDDEGILLFFVSFIGVNEIFFFRSAGLDAIHLNKMSTLFPIAKLGGYCKQGDQR